MRRGTARILVSVATVLMLGACGGGDETVAPSPTASAAGDGVTIEQIDAAASAIDARWGERDGFAVVMLASDRGYSVDQIVERPQIEGDGSIAGVEPDGPAVGLIERAGTSAARWDARRSRSSGSVLVAYQGADGSPADAYVTFIDQSLGELFTAAREHRDRETGEGELEAEVSAVAMGLLARGYTLERVIEAIVLSEWTLASLNAPCLYIPGAQPDGPDQMSSTCPPLSTVEGGSSGDTGASAAASASTSDTDGIYVGDALQPGTAGAVVDVIETTVTVTVTGGEANGRIDHVVVVVTSDAGRTITQHATQTIEFEGAVSPDGTFEGAGRTRVGYVLVSCVPEEQCSGATATSSVPEGVAVTLTGTVRDGVLAAEILNSVSGATSTFEARR